MKEAQEAHVHGIILPTCWALVLAIQAAAVARWALRQDPLRAVRLLRGKCQQLFEGSSRATGSCAEDRIRQRVEAEVKRERMDHLMIGCSAIRLQSWLVFTILLFNRFSGVKRWLSVTQDYLLIFAVAGACAVGYFPDFFRKRPPSLPYNVIMLAMCVGIASSSGDIAALWQTIGLLVMPRLVFSVAYSKMPVVIFWNITFSMCLGIGYRAVLRNERGGKTSRGVWVLEVVILATVLFGALVASRMQEARIHHEVRAKTLSSERPAMLELLHLVCDAVVELDEDLSISEHEPKFAALVMLRPGKSVQGTKLQKYMPHSEDRQRLEEHLLASSTETSHGQPGAFHAAVRDSMGNNVAVEVFYVQFLDLDDRRHYFVGIREFADAQALRELKPGPQAAGLIQEGEASASGPGPEDGAGTNAGADGSRGTQPSLVPEQLAGGQAGSGRRSGSARSRSSASSSGGASSRGRPRVIPYFGVTCDQAMEASLVRTLIQWNFPIQMTTCCPYHAGLMEVKRCLRKLEGHKCARGFGPAGTAQCRGCGLVAPPPQFLGYRRRPKCCPLCDGEWRTPPPTLAL